MLKMEEAVLDLESQWPKTGHLIWETANQELLATLRTLAREIDELSERLDMLEHTVNKRDHRDRTQDLPRRFRKLENRVMVVESEIRRR